MTRSVYIVGGAGVGKSTFTSQLLEGMELGELEGLHALRNAKALVTLRGHRLTTESGRAGLYLGVMRDAFPGSDGLDRASSPTGEAWLHLPERLPSFIIAEGATLATRRFINALNDTTELLLIHLVCDSAVKELRNGERTQKPQFVAATATRMENLVRDVKAANIVVDTADPYAWDVALDLCRIHLQLRLGYSAHP